MNATLEDILVKVDADLETQADILAGYLRTDGDDPSVTYAALTFALFAMPAEVVIDLAFAGIVRAAKVKLAAEDAQVRPRAATDV